MSEDKNFFQRLFTPGTVECAVGCAIVGIGVALLLLWIGVWKTLLICVLAAIGIFVGGVRDKRAFIGRILDAFRRN